MSLPLKQLYPGAFLVVILLISGCSYVNETVKVIWGSSTKALEKARVDAIKKTYRCSFNDCYDAVIALSKKQRVILKGPIGGDDEDSKKDGDDTEEPVTTGIFDVFIENRAKRHIVIMGVEGSVDTTEVGIFFTQPTLTTVGLEITSLSSHAKRKAAEAVYQELDLHFSAVQ